MLSLNRMVMALRSLEASNDGCCAVCGAQTYRDAVVLLRPGYWIEPASFHKEGCALSKVMEDLKKEVIERESK